jgi:AraC-like DNA-binding protein
MSILHEERPSDSPYIETITHGRTVSDGSTIRPAEIHWHMVLLRLHGQTRLIMTGALTTSGIASWGSDAEILWIKLKLGTFMPHLLPTTLLDSETTLPGAAAQSFWLKGSAWQFPNVENVDTFVNRLVHDEVLVHDPLVNAALQDQLKPDALASRTVRHRFLRATGLTQTHIRQMKRAQHAESLLQQGVSILDTVYEAGYFDQPHLTRSLKQFIGHTPAEIIRIAQNCHSVQDNLLASDYPVNSQASG